MPGLTVLARAAALVGMALAFALAGGQSAALAQSRLLILSDSDAAAYQDAFDASEARQWGRMREALDSTSDPALRGSVEARRLLDSSVKPSRGEFEAWLGANQDSPWAEAVFARAKLAGASLSLAPSKSGGRRHPDPRRTPPGDNAEARAQMEAAADAFAAGDFSRARGLAQAGLGGPRAGEAHWRLGLVDFAQHRPADALAHFEQSARWDSWESWGKAASHYWAARSALAAGRLDRVRPNLEAAAAFPLTLYGQIAEENLGRETPLSMRVAELDAAGAAAFVAQHREAYRAAALAQLGRLSEVETELRALHAALPASQDATLLAFAEALQAPAAQLRIAEYGGPEVGAGQCPVSSFAPENGFVLDRALIYAVLRQESRFNPTAVSRSNARGLMQLLPSTAQHVSGEGYRAAPDRLHDPNVNMRLGQTYLAELASGVNPQGDLAKVVSAYNGGPGWLRRWLETFPAAANDPLLMLEAMPRAETRIYSERVLAYLALCRKRYEQAPHELDALASGKAPIYRAQDKAAFAGS